MIRADLHLHTLFSDGAYSPEEICSRAKSAGVLLISVTDHDSMEGTERARAAAREQGLKFVSGIEISAYEPYGRVHVLGYGCEKNEAYRAFSAARVEGALERADEIRTLANAYFHLDVTMEEIKAFQSERGTPLHVMHIVSAFASRLGCDKRQLYADIFSPGKPAFSMRNRPNPTDAVRAIRAMNGIASLAHPALIHLDEREKVGLIRSLVDAGLNGIECVHSAHTEGATAYFQGLKRQFRLLETGGSDFHVDGTERVLGLPEFYASDALMQALSL